MSDVTTASTLPNLGSQPEDPLLVDLVEVNPVSGRLRNAIRRAARQGYLPVQRVSEYLSIGEREREMLMLRMPDIGRKLLDELNDLIRSIDEEEEAGNVARQVAVDAKQVRLALCDRFSEVTVRDGLGQVVLPTRLVHALEQTGVAGEPLSAVLKDREEISLRLSRHPGVGRKTVTAWRESLGEAIRHPLLACGVDIETARAATAMVMEGAVPEWNDLKAITGALASVRPGVALGETAKVDAAAPAPSRDVADVALSAEPWIEAGLESLDERARRVISRRYGLAGRRETLEQIGESLGVTRERVRQIEVKGLRTLKRLIGSLLPEAMRVSGPEQWNALGAGAGYLLTEDTGRARNTLSPWFLLALDVRGIGVREWLDDFSQRVGGGWISRHWSVDDFDAMQQQLRTRLAQTRLPCALSEVSQGFPEKMSKAAVALGKFRTYGTYVIGTRRRLTPRLRRALRLHAALGKLGRCTPILELAAAHAAARPDDRCSTRDCEIVMRDQKHLFLEVMEGNWVPLGPVGDVPEEGTQEPLARDGHRLEPFAVARPASSAGVWTSIAAELESNGPATLGALMRRAREFLPAGRSVHSVGVSMSQRKDVFCRVLPGVYALHHQVPSAADLLAAPPAYVLREDQARVFALARRAGEPWGAYPLWLPETEFLLSAWARRQGKRALLANLLAVARVEEWPDGTDRDRWRELAATRGHFSLHFPMRTETLVAPALEQVFAACLYVRDHGHLSWISGNRVLKRRVWEYWSAGLLAALVGIGALAPVASDWQQPHLPGVRLDEILGQLEIAYREESALSWDSEVGRALVGYAVDASVHGGWVTKGVVRRTFKKVTDGAAAETRSPLDKLLAERAQAKAADAREQLLRSLSGSWDVEVDGD